MSSVNTIHTKGQRKYCRALHKLAARSQEQSCSLQKKTVYIVSVINNDEFKYITVTLVKADHREEFIILQLFCCRFDFIK